MSQPRGRDGAGEGVVATPGVEVSGRHNVDVGVEHQRGTVAAAGEPADGTPARLAVDLHTGEVRLGERLVEGNLPRVDLEAQVREPRRVLVLDRTFLVGPGYRWYADQVGWSGTG